MPEIPCDDADVFLRENVLSLCDDATGGVRLPSANAVEWCVEKGRDVPEVVIEACVFSREKVQLLSPGCSVVEGGG